MNQYAPSEPPLDALIKSLLVMQEATVVENSAPEPENRRTTHRKTFYCWQMMAWYDGKRAPQQTDFHLIECRDLSPSGFSFFSDKKPCQERMIIAIGSAPFAFFEAVTVRCEPAVGERTKGFIVGCRFEKRLEARTDYFTV